MENSETILKITTQVGKTAAFTDWDFVVYHVSVFMRFTGPNGKLWHNP